MASESSRPSSRSISSRASDHEQRANAHRFALLSTAWPGNGAGGPHQRDQLAARGVDKNLAHRARSLHAMPEGKFEREVAKVRRLAAAAAERDREIVQTAKAERHAKARAPGCGAPQQEALP
jgi:hypothetical protein